MKKMKQMVLPKYFKEIDGEIWLIEDERENMKLSYRVKEILSVSKSIFQQVSIIDTYDFGRCLVLDGVIQTTQIDGFIYNEMISHVPLLTHKNPKNVLIIGGGDCGVAKELSKYSTVDRIDMVEIDELVVQESIKSLPEISGDVHKDSRIRFIFEDGVKYIKDKKEEYDIAIIDSSDPIGPAEVLFSEGFYVDLKKSIKEDGLMVCQSQSPVFHKDILIKTQNILKKHYPIVNTYKAVVPSYPGGMWSFTLASLKYNPLEACVENLSKDTKYINKEIFRSAFNLPSFIREYLE
ncbi:UNVERIFIED_CONTAM: spermidine synthase [Acetivibrio alkalicellulosi]